jgi:hypothetical protein
MAAPVKVNFKVYQGSTFEEVLRWETSTKVYKPITAVPNAAPLVVTAVAHGAPIGWRAKISNVVGMKEVNNLDYITITGSTTDTVTFNAINAVGFSTYTSGGILEYNLPHDLVGYTARMQVREKLTSTVVLLELTTANAGIVIDATTAKTITIKISAAITETFTFKSAVYSLELISPGGTVTPFVYGSLVLDQEITR